MSDIYRTSITIEADPETVFDHFVQPELLVRWMGDYARLEARAGGLFAVDIHGVIIRGSFVELDRPRSIEIAWGEAGNDQMPPGSTRLIVRFVAVGSATRVELEHHGLRDGERRKHATGWPHFLARLGSLAAGADPGEDPWKARPPV